MTSTSSPHHCPVTVLRPRVGLGAPSPENQGCAQRNPTGKGDRARGGRKALIGEATVYHWELV